MRTGAGETGAGENIDNIDIAPTEALLSVEDLQVEYRVRRGAVRAVNGVSFDIKPNEVFGLAGESGSGKSTIAYAVTRLHKPPAHIVGGRVMFRGEDVLSLSEEALRAFRWRHASIVFQSAMNALNPVLSIGDQIVDVIVAHKVSGKREARERAKSLLQTVGIDPKRVSSYPHQLSGGMRQRAVIALALALNPELIIMDEPTTALDVVVQKQIMKEIRQLKEQFGFSILFITHDLSLLVELSDRIAIMYAGELIEVAPANEIFRAAKHPYTEQLMNSFPTIHGPRRELKGIPGSPPDLVSPPSGCKFHPRCHLAIEGICDEIEPPPYRTGAEHVATCHLLAEEAA